MRATQHVVLDAFDRAQGYIDDNNPFARSDEPTTDLHAFDDMVNDSSSQALAPNRKGAPDRDSFMRTVQNAEFNAVERSQGFLDDNAAALSGVDLTAARKRLDEVVNTFSSHAFDQDTGERARKGKPPGSSSFGSSCAAN